MAILIMTRTLISRTNVLEEEKSALRGQVYVSCIHYAAAPTKKEDCIRMKL